ncbi:hypothetical protein GKZ89_18390 [Bacillus mangrovi]|uniref:Uncharacterized protein n=1 Tax=Metabacillus mangrovi TaxID=1491830 RepID=A0A7X2S823_9BACI|nr:hypothetical protein [Metabacillus mangrovi]MTH55367.1 hypothetical protein [Metabacillus mangrovi]
MKNKLLYSVTFFIVILGVFLFYLYNFKAIPQMKTNNLQNAIILNLQTKEKINLSKKETRYLAERLGDNIPRNNETSYWKDFENSNRKEPKYKISFYDGEKAQYIYNVSLDNPRYASIESGTVYFWQSKEYPLTDFEFEKLID